MDSKNYSIDGAFWLECGVGGDEGYYWTLEERPWNPTKQDDISFADIVHMADESFKAGVGLAGRMGEAKFEQSFDNFLDASNWALTTLKREFIDKDGQYYGVDAIR